ncbi:MAG: adenosylcobinamide-GDP ribazoletransferase [Candidatus Rokubacteria bacterium]|nr:adenosylcobinamide-GDP ribazoletransferase [Candidatus Rokubacteria bacterium]
MGRRARGRREASLIAPLSGLITAVRFLTIVPVPGRGLDGPDALGRAAAWFPLVGLALGLALAALDRVLAWPFPPLLSALLVLTAWKLLTGGIHLDGLADCLDGLGVRDPERRLVVMRDSRIGAFGALGLILLLLLTLAALAELAPPVRRAGLVLAPLVGRYAPLLLARMFHPASPDSGYGAAFMRAVSAPAVLVGGGFVAICAGLVLGLRGELAGAIGVAVALVAGAFFSRRLHGLTGDGLGAAVELAELGVLLALVALVRILPG